MTECLIHLITDFHPPRRRRKEEEEEKKKKKKKEEEEEEEVEEKVVSICYMLFYFSFSFNKAILKGQ